MSQTEPIRYSASRVETNSPGKLTPVCRVGLAILWNSRVDEGSAIVSNPFVFKYHELPVAISFKPATRFTKWVSAILRIWQLLCTSLLQVSARDGRNFQNRCSAALRDHKHSPSKTDASGRSRPCEENSRRQPPRGTASKVRRRSRC